MTTAQHPLRRRWAPVLLAAALALGAAVGCGSQVTVPSADTDDDPGVQPETPGAVYSACEDPDGCSPLPYCVFPEGEAGFCTQACAPGDDPSSCVLEPGDTDRTICLDIGLPDGAGVCALDCASIGCPEGMRCEDVQTDAGAERVCF